MKEKRFIFCYYESIIILSTNQLLQSTICFDFVMSTKSLGLHFFFQNIKLIFKSTEMHALLFYVIPKKEQSTNRISNCEKEKKR